MDSNRRSVLLGGAALAVVGVGASRVIGPAISGSVRPSSAHRSDATDPAVAAPAPGLRLGPENNAFMFSAATVGGAGLGQAWGGLGPLLYRAVQLPSGYANVPASGDHWLLLRFRTGAVGSSAGRLETLLVSRSGGSSKKGAGVYFASTVEVVGATSTGQDISGAAGLVQIQSAAGGFQLWPQAVLGAPTGAQLTPDTDYALFFGIHNVSGADYGEMILVRLADLTVQTAQSPQPLAAKRATSTAMFDQIGAAAGAGASVDAAGFGGALGDFAVWNAPFPTTAQAILIASGSPPIPGVTGLIGSGALVYWNPLDATSIVGGSIPAQTGPAATAIGANLLPCSPIIGGGQLTLNRLGAHFVFPVATGGADGQVWFEGAAPPGATVNCQLNYLSGGQSTVVQATANANGAFAAAIRSAKGKPFYRQVALATAPQAPWVDGDIMDVGLVIPLIGQSQANHLTYFSAKFGTTVMQNQLANTGDTLPMPGPYAGPWASWIDTVDASDRGTADRHNRGEAARPQIMLGYGMPGDGIVAACASTIAQLGCSVMVVLLTRGGTPMDAMIVDGQTFSLPLALTGSGSTASPFAGTLAITTAAIRGQFGLPGLVLTEGFVNGVSPGSVTLTFPNGGSPVTVTDSFPGYTDATSCKGTLTGPAGATGTIDYLTGAILLTFANPPSAAGIVGAWTVKQETLDAAYKSKSAYIDGWGVRESVDQVGRSGLRYGWSFAWDWWAHKNDTDVAGLGPLTADFSGKIALLQQMMTGGPNYAGYQAPGLALDPGCATPPMIVCPLGRELVGSAVERLSAVDTVRLAAQALWPTGSAPLTFSAPSAWYYDYTVESSGNGHPDHSDQGGRRVGRRLACDWVATFNQARAVNRGPEWGTPTFAGAVCVVPLAYIGSGLKLVTLGNPGALSEWYVGSSVAAGTIVDNGAFATAAIRADGLAVTITKASGAWTGAEVIRYMVGAPASSASALSAPPSLLYDNRGGFDGFEPGLPAAPLFG